VNLVFADNGSPTPNTNTLQYSFSVPATSYVTMFSDGFETYNLGTLDQNLSAGPNAAPDGGPGNPWWGPCPGNLNVVASGENGVTAHGGSYMIRGNPVAGDLDQIWYNLRYRLNAGSAYTGNMMLDWWFYDNLGSGGSANEDFMALAYYSATAATTDWTPGVGNTVCNPSLNVPGSTIQRLSLGCSSSEGAGFDNTKYQARVAGPSDGYAGGWFNTSTPRSVGWHHGRIIVGPSVGDSLATSYNYAQFFIDDMNNPTFWHIDTISFGYNNIEINASYGSARGYYDDVTFAVGRPPNIAVSLSGTTATLTWPGIDFVLQSASSLTSPITWTDVVGATSPYDTPSNPEQYFRLRNH
jgi:hypothetical protein